MERQKVFHSQISSLDNKHVLISATLSHNSGKAQPIFGGATKLSTVQKISENQTVTYSTILRRLKAMREYKN
jgi:hypothetical protein